MVILSFLFFLAIIIAIGIASSIFRKKTNADYLLADHNIPAWLVGLSAVATNNSGYMFIGMIGFSYSVGISSVWLMIGWVFGDFLVSFLVHKRLSEATQQRHVISFGGLLSKWQGSEYKKLRVLTGLVTLIFLGVYAAAQFKAGSKALHVLFGWNYHVGAIIGGAIVFVYCLSGGIRATIWTDAAQSFVMFISMLVLFVTAILTLGGVASTWLKLSQVSNSFTQLTPTDLLVNNIFGFGLFILGWVLAGVGVIGQPHIMSRFMAIKSPALVNKARAYYYCWYITFFSLTIGVGLMARLLIPEVSAFDPELALPTVSLQLLPSVMVGFVLAGIFSATMSTADSQILSCTAAVVRDILPLKNCTLLTTKITTGFITIAAILIALYGNKNVFQLVLISWSVLAAAFSPLLIIYALKKPVSENLAMAMVVFSIIGTLGWRYLGLSDAFYEVGPGIILGLIIYAVLNKTSLNRANNANAS